MKTTKIGKGYYEVTDKNGQLWEVEHVTKSMGFNYDEWHVGTTDDPHANQYDTKRECLEAIQHCEDHPELYN